MDKIANYLTFTGILNNCRKRELITSADLYEYLIASFVFQPQYVQSTGQTIAFGGGNYSGDYLVKPLD